MRKVRVLLVAIVFAMTATVGVTSAPPAGADHCGTFHQYGWAEDWNEEWQDPNTGAWYYNHVHADVYGHYDHCTWQLEYYDYHNQHVVYTHGPYWH